MNKFTRGNEVGKKDEQHFLQELSNNQTRDKSKLNNLPILCSNIRQHVFR